MARQEPSESAPQLPEARRYLSPFNRLQTKAVLAVVAIVCITSSIGGYLSAKLAEQTLRQTLSNDLMLAGEQAHQRLTEHLAQRRPITNATLENLISDPRLAFITVTDLESRAVARRINNPTCWSRYLHNLSPQIRHGAIGANQPIILNDGHDEAMAVLRVPLWGGPTPEERAELRGYIIVSLADPTHAQMLANLRGATVAVVCGACLLGLPITIWWARRWTTPLKQMLRGVTDLAADTDPQPLKIVRRDEIGLLGRGFNAMAGSLRQARAALVRANQNLEQKVKKRTELLIAANSRLHNEMREKDDFIRAVSHDLNAPLRNISGMAQLLLTKYKNELSEDATLQLERILANAKVETELLADLLELSRIRAHAGRRQEVAVEKTVKDLIAALSFEAESKGITFHVDTPLPRLRIDPSRIRQVFQNLLDNAIKYTPPETANKEIHVGFTQESKRLLFYVRDYGRGIDPQDQELVFQLFQRSRHSGPNLAPGRGVGLACVKAIVESYGGEIWLESKLGEGSVFYFSLPAQLLASAKKEAPETVGTS